MEQHSDDSQMVAVWMCGHLLPGYCDASEHRAYHCSKEWHLGFDSPRSLVWRIAYLLLPHVIPFLDFFGARTSVYRSQSWLHQKVMPEWRPGGACCNIWAWLLQKRRTFTPWEFATAVHEMPLGCCTSFCMLHFLLQVWLKPLHVSFFLDNIACFPCCRILYIFLCSRPIWQLSHVHT